jgi:hypothetical protein
MMRLQLIKTANECAKWEIFHIFFFQFFKSLKLF